MSMTTVLKNMIDEKLKSTHVAFLAEVLLVNNNKAKIQPLGLVRDYGGTAQKQAVITNVHIAQSARYRVTPRDIEGAANLAQLTPIRKGDIVLCVCCDRNIDDALKGKNTLPMVGYHKLSDCVIVSII